MSGIKMVVEQNSTLDFIDVRVEAFVFRIKRPIISKYAGEQIGWDASMEQMEQARKAADQVAGAVREAFLDTVYSYLKKQKP